jgi:hypothetical protein
LINAAQRCALPIGLKLGYDIFLQMSSKTWVCALCSQDFTRKYSAYRHSRDLHQGRGKIVRMIDYVIGRIAGKYNPGNPLSYRSRYKQTPPTFARSDSKAFTFPLDAKASTAHDSSQRNSFGALAHNKEHQQPNTNSVQPSTTPISGFTTKFEGIQGLARTLYGPEKAEALLKELNITIIEGKEEILDRYLEELKNKMNMKEACPHLFGAPVKEVNKRPPLHGHRLENLSESSRVKLTQIEQILTMNLKNDVAVFEKIKEITKVCNSQPRRQHFILDLWLDSLGGTPQTNN